MIKKIAFNAYHNPNIKTIIELKNCERIIVCYDKWELVNDLRFFKSIGNLISSRISINEDLIINLVYSDIKIRFYLYNIDEIDLRQIGPYQKIY